MTAFPEKNWQIWTRHTICYPIVSLTSWLIQWLLKYFGGSHHLNSVGDWGPPGLNQAGGKPKNPDWASFLKDWPKYSTTYLIGNGRWTGRLQRGWRHKRARVSDSTTVIVCFVATLSVTRPHESRRVVQICRLQIRQSRLFSWRLKMLRSKHAAVRSYRSVAIKVGNSGFFLQNVL